MNTLSVKALWLVFTLAFMIQACGGGGGGGEGATTVTYTVGGTVSGLSGTVVLQNNGGDNLGITANGAFTFGAALANGAAFSVTVLTQPSAQTCTVANGSGTIAGANVTNLTVSCINSGSLDSTFGSAGIVVQNNAAGGNGSDSGFAITLDSSGKILIAGQSVNAAGNTDMVIWRYNADGTPDTTFNFDGKVVHNNAAGGNGDDFGRAIALDPSGRILVAGESLNAAGNFDMVIWRYNANGTPDTTFDTDGVVVHSNAAGGINDDNGNAIALDSSGRILVAGTSFNIGGTTDLVIWRYNANGTLDTTFDADGIVMHNSAAGGNGADFGVAIVLDSSGRILVAGTSRNAALNDDLVIWRYNTNGTLDTTFDTDGIVTHNNAAGGNSHDAGSAIALDSSGRILVAGTSRNAALNDDLVIWRYKPDGTLDGTFDTDGIVVHNNAGGGNGADRGFDIALDSSGRILAAGNSVNEAGNFDMIIWRYNTDGTPDGTFDTDGIVIHNNAAGGVGSDSGLEIVLDSSGRILVTGSSDSDATAGFNSDLVIWRYNP